MSFPESNLGQPTKADLRDLLAYFPRLHRAAIFRKIKADPTIQGFVLFVTHAIGERGGKAVLPFGPNCETLKDWRDAVGKPLNTGDHALTNPAWAVHYATIPVSFPMGQIDELILLEELAGVEELPKFWTKDVLNRYISMNDRLRNPETGAELLVLTFGDSHLQLLVCPATAYSTEIETNPESPDFQYPKGHQHWEWIKMQDAFDREYTVLVDHHLMPYGTLVASKREATKQ